MFLVIHHDIIVDVRSLCTKGRKISFRGNFFPTNCSNRSIKFSTRNNDNKRY